MYIENTVDIVFLKYSSLFLLYFKVARYFKLFICVILPRRCNFDRFSLMFSRFGRTSQSDKMIAEPMKLCDLATRSSCFKLVCDWADDDNPPIIDKWIDSRQNMTSCPDHDRFIWQMYEMPLCTRNGIILPTPILNQIEDNITSILDPIRTWLRVHHVLKFFHQGSSSRLNEYVKSIVFTKDCNVDYTATAKKISGNTNIKSIERFRFVCSYCIIEDLKNFTDEAKVLKDLVFEIEPFIVYWSKYLFNELDTITNIDYNLLLSSLVKSSDTEFDSSLLVNARAELFPAMDESIEGTLFEISLNSYQLWPAVEYFFTKLEPRMQLRRFNEMIKRCGERDRQDILSNFGDEQWIAAGRFSIKNLIVLNIDHFEDTRFIWTQFKDQIDLQNFCHLMEELIKVSMKNPTNFGIWTPFLIEIWTSVSDEFKRAATNVQLWCEVGHNYISMNNPIEEKFDFSSRLRITEPMKFIRHVLSDMDPQNKEIFLQNNFFWLIIWQPFVSVKKLLKEFLVTRNIVNFKKQLKESADVEIALKILAGYGEFEEIDSIVLYYLSGKNDNLGISHQHLASYKRTLIVSNGSSSICLYFINWRKLYEYVKKIIQNTTIHICSCMIAFIDFGCNSPVDYVEEKITRGEIRDIMDCLNFIISSDDSRLTYFKKRIKIGLYRCLFDFDWTEKVHFKRAQVQDCLMWIYSNNQALIDKNFRKTKLFRKGFLVQFKTCVDEHLFEASNSMDEYLQWCFPNEEERKSFKRNMIYQYRKYEPIRDILWMRKFRRPMLSWFFDNDKSLINEFVNNHVGANRDETVKST